jgi:DNA-binding XRE family transcriptional regulator
MNRNKVREFRQKAGITQTELAWRVHIPCTNMSAIECGRLAPWPKVRKAIAEALGICESEIFSNNGNKEVSIDANL